MARHILCGAAALFAFVVFQPLPQARQAGAQGSITGRVIDATTGKPIGGASVSVTIGPRDLVPRRSGVTAADGLFAIGDVPRGTYGLVATASGYAAGFYGVVRPHGTSVTLAVAGEKTTADIPLRMWRAATIRGTITDDTGRPVAGATVEARSRQARGYGSQLGIPKHVVTDARGTYEIAGLSPDDYLVAVLFTPTSIPMPVLSEYRDAMSVRSDRGQALIEQLSAIRVPIPVRPSAIVGLHSYDVQGPDGPAPSPRPPGSDGTVVVYQTTFFPSSESVAKAGVVHVSAGDDKSSVDFHLATRSTVRVSGTVIGPNGPAAYYGLRLVAPDDPPATTNEAISEISFDNAETITDAHGAFTFLGVPAGHYAIKTSPEGGVPWVRSDIDVKDTNITNLALTMHPGLRVHGHVAFDGNGPPPAGDQIRQARVARLGLVIGGGIPSPAGVAPADDLTFVTDPYAPGRYMTLLPGIGSWMLQSAMLDGRDVSTVPFELVDKDLAGLVITYTNRRALLAGTVRLDAGLTPAAIEVIAFPADYEGWMQHGLPSHLPSRTMRVVRLTADGTFLIFGLAAGDYAVAAYKAEDGGPPGADRLARIARVATRVSIKDGEQTTAALAVVDVR